MNLNLTTTALRCSLEESMTAFITPFAAELRTNFVPSWEDTQEIKELLVGPRKRLIELEDKISEMERELNSLRQQRVTLDDEIQEHTRLLAPFRQFPDDMLQEIFLACLPDDRNASMSPDEAPLVLGRVCRRWRAMAYSLPRLWASLHIPYPQPNTRHHAFLMKSIKNMAYYDRQTDQQIQAVKDWLNRSGSCPLSISFHPHYEQLLRVHWEPYLAIMESVSHRWYRVEMTINGENLARVLIAMPKTSVPLLKHLHLAFLHEGTGVKGWESSGLLNNFQLQTLDVTHFPFQPTKVLGIDWSNLSVLNLVRMGPYRRMLDNTAEYVTTIQEAHYILSRYKRLVHCTIDILDRHDSTFLPDPISLPFLESITIFDTCAKLSTLFECFSDISALRTVSYHLGLAPSGEPKSPLITLLSLTNNQITTLCTYLASYTMDDLCEILSLVPNLEHLICDVYPMTQSLLRSNQLPRTSNAERASLDLLAPLSGQTYCPRLKSMEFKPEALHSIRDEYIVSFLQRRMDASKSPTSGIEPLREFRADFKRHIQQDVRSQLMEYIENGPLVLTLSYYAPVPAFKGEKESLPSQFRPHARLVCREPQSGIIKAARLLV